MLRIKLNPLHLAPMNLRLLPPSLLNQNPPHRLRRRSKEVTTPVSPHIAELRAVSPLPPGRGAGGEGLFLGEAPFNRNHASCTSAVGCNVCPGFSWANCLAAICRSSS